MNDFDNYNHGFKIDGMKEQKYSGNGIDIYTMTNSGLKSFCLSLYIRIGSIFETEENNGISHFFEHIVFRNLKKAFPDFYNLLGLHGLDVDACTYKEFIYFSVSGRSAEFRFAADIMCALFQRINVSREDFEKEKRRIKAEIREENERTTVDYHFEKAVWKNTEAEKTVLGRCTVLDRISEKKINEFIGKYVSRKNLFFYITGSVSENDVGALIRKLQAFRLEKGTAVNRNIITLNDEFFNREFVVNVQNGSWYDVKIGFDIDCLKHGGGTLDMLYSVLFEGDKAMAYNYLSEDAAAVYSYDSTFEQYDNIGNISCRFEVGEKDIERAIKKVVEMLNDVKHAGFNFQSTRNYALSKAELNIDNPSVLNWNIAYYNHILKTEPIDYSKTSFGRFAVTKEQVVAAAADIFRTNNMTVFIKGKKKKINVTNIEEILKHIDE